MLCADIYSRMLSLAILLAIYPLFTPQGSPDAAGTFLTANDLVHGALMTQPQEIWWRAENAQGDAQGQKTGMMRRL